MGTSETEGNLSERNNNTHSNNNQELSNNTCNKSLEELNYVNGSKCKKNNGFNGELENYSAVDNNNNQSSLKSTKTYNNNHNSSKYYNTDETNSNYTLKTAGLCSERCTRDFVSVKNRKYHWSLNKMSENEEFNSNKRFSSEINDSRLNGDSIFQSNCMMRNENRIKNTSHSDIFGVNNENSFKRKARSNSFQDNRSYSETNSTLSSRDDENDNLPDDKHSDKSKEEIEETERENKKGREEEVKRGNYYTENEDNLKNYKEDENNLPTNMTIKLSKLKSETNEKDLIKMCNNCDLKVLSVNLDRNIINHNCTGTGKLVVKARKRDLANFQNLLNSQGVKYII